MQKIILLLIILVQFFPALAQRRQQTWQDYLSFANATRVEISSDRVFCVTEGGLFYYDLQDNSIGKRSSLNGLSDYGVKTIAYSEPHELLIVAYENSNIDLVYRSKIINLSDIKRKQITGDKTIYNITVAENEAYLSCGFGIVVINLDKNEIKDTYLIGDEGAMLKVNDTEIFNGNIYAATEKGILTADRNTGNLLDFNNWSRMETIPHPNDEFTFLAFHAGSLIASYHPGGNNPDELYAFSGSDWQRYLPEIYFVTDMQVNNSFLTVSANYEVFVVDAAHTVIGRIGSYSLADQTVEDILAKSAGISQNGILWIADYENGLIRMEGSNFEQIIPNGPIDNKIFGLTFHNGTLWVLPGGHDDSWNNVWEKPHFQKFATGNWNLYSKKDYPGLDGFWDIVDIAIDPLDPQHFFVASWGGGLLEFRGEQLVQRYTNQNSPLQTALPQQPDDPYVRIGGIDFDSEGNLWITNSEVAKNLVKLTPAGEWELFTLPGVANTRNIGEVLVTENDDKWILVPRGHDAYVVDRTGTEKKRLMVTSYFNNGVNEIFNRMNDVFSIAEDHDGAIWIGTSKGVAVYNNPYRIWNTDNFYAVQPSLDLNDGLYHPLLETETVSAIAVDGANRKWLGTKNSGVYLISENGEEELAHFTKENSPLLSNNITALAIEQKTGEVFIGTDEGLVSYQGDAIGGNNSFADVYVYPNPVRETYDGPVVIKGLMENSDVKITDIGGNLVHQATSLGGQVSWDGNNLNGNRVRTGIYLVFCSDETGEETHIAKLMFIN